MRLFFSFFLLLPLTVQAEANSQIVITKANVGPITEKTEFSAAKFKTLFPGFVVEKGEDGFEDQSWTIFKIVSNKKTLMSIAPQYDNKKAIALVKVFDPTAHTDDGIKIGSVYSDLRKNKKLGECKEGFEQEHGSVKCKSATANNIELVLSTERPKMEPGLRPEAELGKYKVTELRWSPARK